MSYYATGFTEEQEGLILQRTQLLVDRSNKLVEMNTAEESRRKWTFALGVAGAIFAAIKLGIVAVPAWRKRKSHEVGTL